MTQDDLEIANISDSQFSSVTISNSNEGAADTITACVEIAFTIPDTLWDAAKASAADALVLVQWLESKRPE